MSILAISCLIMSSLPWFMDLTFQVPKKYILYSTGLYFPIRHIYNWGSFPLWPSCFLLSEAVGNCPPLYPSSKRDTFWPAGLSFWCQIFFLFRMSMGFSGKNTGVGCHFLLQWTTFCQNSALWPVPLGWPGTEWLIASSPFDMPWQGCDPWNIGYIVIKMWDFQRINITGKCVK